MPTLCFERTNYQIDVPEGGRVLDICDQHPRAGIPFSCRGANCGTCRVEVIEGLEYCEPPGEHETELLDIFGDGPEMRLGCQIRIKPGDGRVRLRVTL